MLKYPAMNNFNPTLRIERNHASSCLNEKVESWGDSLLMSCFCSRLRRDRVRAVVSWLRRLGWGSHPESCVTAVLVWAPVERRDTEMSLIGRRATVTVESPHSCNSGWWLVTATLDNMSLFGSFSTWFSPSYPQKRACVWMRHHQSVSMHNQVSECTISFFFYCSGTVSQIQQCPRAWNMR